MPRSKLSNASPRFSARPHLLSNAATEKLINLLGYPPGDATDNDKLRTAIHDVQRQLGAYPELEKNVDSAPRPTNYVATFKSIQKEAEKLLGKIADLNGYLSDQLKSQGADVDEVKKTLLTLCDTSRRIVVNFSSQPSKGAKNNAALTQTIRKLRIIFRATYQGPASQRRKRGAFQWLAEPEKCEIEFVYAALRDARIIRESYKRELPRLFKDARCALPGERTQVVDRLARRVSRKRKQ